MSARNTTISFPSIPERGFRSISVRVICGTACAPCALTYVVPTAPIAIPAAQPTPRSTNVLFMSLSSVSSFHPCLPSRRRSIARRYDSRRLDHEDDASLGRARPVHDAARNGESLARQKLDAAPFEIDEEAPVDDIEELVLVVVLVPVVFALQHAQAHDRIV